MEVIQHPDDAEKKEAVVRLGFTIGTYTPTFVVPHDVGREMREAGDIDEAVAIVADWWDALDAEERAEAMKLDEKDGRTVAENIIFADLYDEDMGRFKPVFEA